MTKGLVGNWNSVVAKEDIVYHIGDFAMGDKNKIPEIRAMLNGKIILVYGNHDCKHNGQLMPQIINGGFDAIHKELYVTVDGIKLYLNHIPDMAFVSNEAAQYHICGHVHQAFTRANTIINAGVDVCGYRPVSLEFLINQPEIKGEPHRGY